MINNKGLDLIKYYEGLRLSPYLDTGKVPTIGYGTTIYPNGIKVTIKDPRITKKIAEEYLLDHIKKVEEQLASVIKVKLNENQYSALISFTYNLGITQVKNSTLMKLINKNQLLEASSQFERWIFDNGVKLNGLIERRKKEKDLFNESIIRTN